MRRLTALSTLGAVVMAAVSWSDGAVPAAWSPPLIPAAMVAHYLGLAALIGSWLVLGRRLLVQRAAITATAITRYALCTAAPLLLAAPLGRDLWAYAAQGHLTGTGADPYSVGPAAAPGAFADEVSRRWLHSPAPYGPVWLRASQAAAWVAHGHPLVAALLLRLPAYLGLALCCWAIPRLARRLGGPATVALWLGAADPLMTVLGVGGGHNDLLMMGLALTGLVLACGAVDAAVPQGLPALAAGAAVASSAALIKSPAAVVVAFTLPAWLFVGRRQTVRDVLAGCATAVAAAAATVAVLTAATGLGFGWTRQVNSDAQWVSWLSLPSAASMLGKWLTGAAHPRELDATLRGCRTVGEVLAVVALVGLWLLAVRRALRTRPQPPMGPLAAALAVAALLGPSVQPWYYLWALLLAGLVVRGRAALAVLASVPVMFTVMITPSGVGLESKWSALLIVLGSWLLVGRALRGVRSRKASGQLSARAL